MSANEYVPLNYCATCGSDFTAVAYFDRHRVGTYAYTFSEGMGMDPPRDDGRRCLDEDEMAAVGLVRLKPGDSSRHDARVASGIPLYWDPDSAAMLRSLHAASSGAIEALRAAA